MTLNAWGLAFDLIGVVLIAISAEGLIIPPSRYLMVRRVIPQWGGRQGFGDKLAKVCLWIGWLTLIAGLSLQLVAEFDQNSP